MFKRGTLTIQAMLLCLSASMMTSCGRSTINDLPLPSSVEAFVQTNRAPSRTLAGQNEDSKKLDKIISSLGEIKDILSEGIVAAPAGTTRTTKTRTTSSSRKASTSTTPDATDALPDDTPAKSETTAPQEDILAKIVEVLNNSPGLTVELKKTERNLKTGEMTGRATRMTTNQSKVKVEVLDGEKKGTKLLYDVGSPKVGVRPNGGLSWVTTELAQNDDRLTTTNGYTLLQIDLASLSSRMGGSTYSAELIGKTTVGGETVHVVKITTSATNELEPAITHEHIAFNPTTYNIKYWEAYTGESKEPYLSYMMTSFKVGPVSASDLKL